MAERDAEVARFLVERHFVPSKNLVKPHAFLPGRQEGPWSTSVFLVDGVSDEDLWDRGRIHVADPRNKPLYGRADVGVSYIIAAGLTVKHSEPPEGHREILGWSDEKQDRLAVAQDLASNATLKLNPRLDAVAPTSNH